MRRSFEETLRTTPLRDLSLREPIVLPPGATIGDALSAMQQNLRPCVLVGEAGRVAGIFTERDVLTRLHLEGLDPAGPIAGVMTPAPRTLSPDDTVGEAIRVMTREGFRHLPLVETSGPGVGLVSARDLVVFLAEHFPAEVLNLPPFLHQSIRRTDGG